MRRLAEVVGSLAGLIALLWIALGGIAIALVVVGFLLYIAYAILT